MQAKKLKKTKKISSKIYKTCKKVEKPYTTVFIEKFSGEDAWAIIGKTVLSG